VAKKRKKNTAVKHNAFPNYRSGRFKKLPFPTIVCGKSKYTGWGTKSNPLKFFAVFSATVCHFNINFYTNFVTCSTANCQVKCNAMKKNDKIIDF